MIKKPTVPGIFIGAEKNIGIVGDFNMNKSTLPKNLKAFMKEITWRSNMLQHFNADNGIIIVLGKACVCKRCIEYLCRCNVTLNELGIFLIRLYSMTFVNAMFMDSSKNSSKRTADFQESCFFVQMGRKSIELFFIEITINLEMFGRRSSFRNLSTELFPVILTIIVILLPILCV